MSQLGGEVQVLNTTADRGDLPALQAKPDPAITISEGRRTGQSSSQDAGNPIAVKDSEKARIASSGAVARATIPRPSIFPEREPWSIASGYGPHSLDRAFKANLARLTFGLSPAVMAEQTFDWMAHLAISPGKQLELTEKWFRKSARLNLYAMWAATGCAWPICAPALRSKSVGGSHAGERLY